MKKKDFLNLLGHSKTRRRREKLLDISDRSEIEAISECVKNLLSGNIPLKKKDIPKVRKHANALRAVSKKNVSLKRKRQLLKQTGGVLPFLLPLAVSVVSSLAKKVFK